MKFWSNSGQIRHWVSRKSAKNATLLERTHHRDKLYVTHLIKSGYQLLLTWMRTFTLKSKILRCIFTRSSSRLCCSVFIIYRYMCIIAKLKYYNHYLLSFQWRKLQKYIRESYLNMRIFGLWIYNVHFHEMPLLWSILTINTIETHKKPKC